MANKIFPKFKQALLGAGVNLASGTVKAVLIDSGRYTYADAHQFLPSVPAAARIGTPATLANKTVVDGVFDADDSMFTSVPAQTGTASAEEAILLYRDSGTEATSELIAYIDTATGLPVTPNGGNIVVTWAAAGIFAL
jgi:hypothetical protein